MCLDGGAFLFLQDSTQWCLSLQTEQIQVLRHRHLPDRHDAGPVIVAHVQIQKRLHKFSVEEAEGMAIILVPVSFAIAEQDTQLFPWCQFLQMLHDPILDIIVTGTHLKKLWMGFSQLDRKLWVIGIHSYSSVSPVSLAAPESDAVK